MLAKKRCFNTWLIIAALLFVGCLGPMDMLGVSEAVSERRVRSDDEKVEPETLKYDEERWVKERFADNCVLELNKSATITKLDIAPFDDDDRHLDGKLFRGRTEAAENLMELLDDSQSLIPSMEVVNGALKPFNDGLYASIETGVQQGVEMNGETVFPAKQQFLVRLLEGLKGLHLAAGNAGELHVERAMVHLMTALRLSNTEFDMWEELEGDVSSAVMRFREASLFSRPIGFYTWTDTLQQIFMQDRFLQFYDGEVEPFSDDEVGMFAAMAIVLKNDEALLGDYERILALYGRLTNPFMDFPITVLLPFVDAVGDLESVDAIGNAVLGEMREEVANGCQLHLALFPGSTSKETAYFESLFCRGTPDEVDYLQTLIDGIKDGLVDLAPTEESGWYDYQSHALETLLLPERASEAAHLQLSEAYREKLVETFKSILIQNRETHVKQLSIGGGIVSAKASFFQDVYPLFKVEPFPTFYLRNARAYRFLKTWLSTILGESFLSSLGRLDESGVMSDVSLADELHDHALLLYGLYFIAADSVGLAPSLLDEELLEFDETQCREAATRWLENWRNDADVAKDPRVIVPVQRDYEQEETIYWATVGVKVVNAEAEFDDNSLPKTNYCSDDSEDCDGSYCSPGDFVSHFYYLLVEESVEVRLPMNTPPPTRREFRELCDRYDNSEDIVRALTSL